MANQIYANARAKAHEKYLLGRERINRMIDAETPEEAIKILFEVGFGDGISLENAGEFERLINIENQKFSAFLSEHGAPTIVADYFLIKNDYHNAEAFLKEKYLKNEDSSILVEDGRIEKNSLKDRIMTDDYSSLPTFMKDALLECDAQFVSNSASGQSVNAVFTKAYFKHLYSVCKDDKTLKRLYEFKVDSINIGTAIRARNFSLANDWFLSYGTLSQKDLKELCEEQLETLKERFRYSEYKDVISLAIDAKLKNKPLSEFEKRADELSFDLLKKQKYSTEGLLPYILYCTKKTSEIFNVRVILVGLLNGLDKAQIRERIRNVYEG